jgi:NADH-quinone oxidoreductase subunit L
MRLPILVLAVPSALLGLAAFAPGFRHALELEDPHLGVAILLPLLLLATGAGTAWWLWWAVPGVDPVVALGRAGPLFASGFHLDHVQSVFFVRPVKAIARLAKLADERVVDATVEGTGTATRGLGGLFAEAHRTALPGAAVLVLFGALVLGIVAWLGALS